ncbi:MAG: L-serine ammonia-lyase, iron-sulfur-dependent, subunit alpha [Lachnospiraceae bacterium]|nr:L-serine ammonia-lyase, iron-sulfur-dependent, subunit alpha [Lachnospiraceae bacterium]
MHELTKLIKDDMKPALGVTEPGAIAFAVSTARSYLTGEVRKIGLKLNSGMYKNAYTCGIPGSSHVGNLYSAALGAVAGRPEKGLESLAEVTEADNKEAERMVEAGMVTAEMTEVTSRIFIQALVETESGTAVVTIRDSHTNIVEIRVKDEVVFAKEEKNGEENREEGEREEGEQAEGGKPDAAAGTEPQALIHRYTLEQIYEYITTVDAEEIRFIMDAYRMNYALFEEGLNNPKTTYARYLLQKNGGEIISKDEQRTASLLCNAAIEARVIGLDKPAMSITGSGAHGIIATMPLYAAVKVNGLSEEKLLRATALSYLICMYIKEYSGRLSAFCGCGIAAGSGMACGLVYLKGGSTEQMAMTLNNMASGLTGMICDGGNKGCTMKGIVAVDSAFQSVDFAMQGIFIDNVHGINGRTPEETMHNMGRIASPGMVGTEKTIVEIMESK